MTTPRLSGRIAVTGAGGFVGSWLRRHLAAAGGEAVEIVPLLDREAGYDIRDPAAVSAAVAATRPDAVVHLAAIAAPAAARADPTAAWEVNVMGTLALAEAMQAHAPAALLVFAGSSEAYGASFAASDVPIDEDAPLAPCNVYGATKAAADLMIGQMAFDGLRAVRFRPFNHAGPGQSGDYVVAAFARQIARIEKGLQPPVLSVGNLEPVRDFLDVRDVVAAYVEAIRRREGLPAGVAMNLATSRPVRIGALLEALLAEAAVPIEVRPDPARFRPSDIPHASGSATRARDLLGWTPAIPLERTIRDVLDHWRQAPES